MNLTLEEREIKKKLILKFAFELEKIYPNSNFKHHCYLRIAYDNTLESDWRKVIQKPFLTNCKSSSLITVLNLLQLYIVSEQHLIEDNKKSLYYRGIIKKL